MTVQTSLFDDPGFDDLNRDLSPRTSAHRLDGIVRQPLARGAWVDLLPGWLTGTTDLFDVLMRDVGWESERRPMYDKVVDVPRLLAFYGEHDPLPHPALEQARDALNRHYAAELGEPFTTAGLCLYRDGSDSVAWHGDTIGRGRSADTMVAIVSLGSPRELLLRPRGGGAVARAIAAGPRDVPTSDTSNSDTLASRTSAVGPGAIGSRAVSGSGTIRHTLHHGDLIVMGGSCQRTWEHAVPKTARPVGPRVSVQFRPRGVR